MKHTNDFIYSDTANVKKHALEYIRNYFTVKTLQFTIKTHYTFLVSWYSIAITMTNAITSLIP